MLLSRTPVNDLPIKTGGVALARGTAWAILAKLFVQKRHACADRRTATTLSFALFKKTLGAADPSGGRSRSGWSGLTKSNWPGKISLQATQVFVSSCSDKKRFCFGREAVGDQPAAGQLRTTRFVPCILRKTVFTRCPRAGSERRFLVRPSRRLLRLGWHARHGHR